MQKNQIIIICVALVIVISLLIGVLVYKGQGIQEASLDRFDLTGIKGITPQGFTLVGNLYVKNPSDLSVPIKSITYDAMLKEKNEVIGSGTLTEFTLEKSTTSKIPFEQKIQWTPTVSTAIELATKEKVFLVVKGKLNIDIPQIENYDIPFEQQTDIKEFLVQFIEEAIPADLPVGEVMDQLASITQPQADENPIEQPDPATNTEDELQQIEEDMAGLDDSISSLI